MRVCDVSDVPVDSMHAADVGGKRLMVVNFGGQLYATDRICTHEEADLSKGFLMGSAVTCPLHLSRFDVVSGEVQNAPASVPLKTYSLKVEGTTVYVQL